MYQRFWEPRRSYIHLLELVVLHDLAQKIISHLVQPSWTKLSAVRTLKGVKDYNTSSGKAFFEQ
jgi:hypothetical protein